MERYFLKKLHQQITADLTVGKEDNDEKPWLAVDVRLFIAKHNHLLQKIVNSLMLEGEDQTMPDDGFREYLYSYKVFATMLINDFTSNL